MNAPHENPNVTWERCLEPKFQEEDRKGTFRPQNFQQYPGQKQVKDNLSISVTAAKKLGRVMDHVLLHGPPGLGKTTLAQILAQELEVPFVSTSGPVLDKPGDVAGLLASLENHSLLFVDEIHRLSTHVEEVLYGAMEDFVMDLFVGQGAGARSLKVPVAPFTLVGATTQPSKLSKPFLSRFGIQEKLDYYSPQDLEEILSQSCDVLALRFQNSALKILALSSRGTPRIAHRLLRRVQDLAVVEGLNTINEELVNRCLKRLAIDAKGLDNIDRRLLRTLSQVYAGGPVGLGPLALSMGEDKSTIQDVYEPFLVHQGLIARTPRGRILTSLARELENLWLQS